MGVLGFETPLGLLALGLLGPVAWLYLRVREQPPAAVSSLRLWESIAEPPEPRRRPKLPLRFFLQAALVVALALALAQPWFAGAPSQETATESPEHIIVLDNSASMRARHGDGTRFEQARAAALDRLAELAADGSGRFTIVVAGGRDETLIAAANAAAAREAIAGARAGATAGKPGAAIEAAAARLGSDGSIDVFTDAPPSALVVSRDALARTRIHPTGQSGSNLSIADLGTTLGRLGGGEARALVTVRHPDAAPRRVRVVLQRWQEPVAVGAAAPAGEAPAASSGGTDGPAAATELDVPAHGSARAVLGPVEWRGPFVVRLEAAAGSAGQDTAPDDFELDDTAFGVFAEPRSFRLRLVTQDTALGAQARALAEAHGGITVEVVRNPDAPATTPPDVTIFDRAVPRVPPPGAVAYLAPAAGNADVRLAGRIAGARISASEPHPVLASTARPEILLDVAGDTDVVEIVPDPRLARVLTARAAGREIALLQAGEIDGRRVALSALRLPGRTLASADGVPALVFLVDLLHWLAPAGANAPQVATAGAAVVAKFPDGAPIEQLEGPAGALVPDAAGRLHPDEIGAWQAMGQERAGLLLISFRDPVESEIAATAEAHGDAAREDAATTSPDLAAAGEALSLAPGTTRVPLTTAPLALAAALLAAEWLLVTLAARRAQGDEDL